MPPEQLQQMLRAQPFVPFRIHLTDGRQFDVRHPDLAIAARTYAVIGIPAPNDPAEFAGRHETVALIHIVSLEPLQQTAQAG